VPHPIPVPHPVTFTKPVFIPVPKAIPIPQSSHDERGVSAEAGGDHAGYEAVNYNSYIVNAQGRGVYDQQNGDQAHFQPSEPDHSANH